MREYIYLIAPLGGWVVAQSIKFVLTLRKDGITFGDAVQSGGMPSSHTALIVALTTVIGLEADITSVAFGIAATVSGIVVYDALGVRRTTGQQTEAIRTLAKASKTKLGTIDNAKGHTVPEVVVGGLVGILVGVLLYNFL